MPSPTPPRARQVGQTAPRSGGRPATEGAARAGRTTAAARGRRGAQINRVQPLTTPTSRTRTLRSSAKVAS
jgi:hypothetical protein